MRGGEATDYADYTDGTGEPELNGSQGRESTDYADYTDGTGERESKRLGLL